MQGKHIFPLDIAYSQRIISLLAEAVGIRFPSSQPLLHTEPVYADVKRPSFFQLNLPPGHRLHYAICLP